MKLNRKLNKIMPYPSRNSQSRKIGLQTRAMPCVNIILVVEIRHKSSKGITLIRDANDTGARH